MKFRTLEEAYEAGRVVGNLEGEERQRERDRQRLLFEARGCSKAHRERLLAIAGEIDRDRGAPRERDTLPDVGE